VGVVGCEDGKTEEDDEDCALWWCICRVLRVSV